MQASGLRGKGSTLVLLNGSRFLAQPVRVSIAADVVTVALFAVYLIQARKGLVAWPAALRIASYVRGGARREVRRRQRSMAPHAIRSGMSSAAAYTEAVRPPGPISCRPT